MEGAQDQSRPPAYETGLWSNGVFGCFNNIGISVVGFLLPCVLFGQTSDLLQGKSCPLYGCLFLVPFVSTILQADQREIIRRIRGVPGTSFNDFCMVFLCPLCSLVQQAQEVERLNLDGYAFPVGEYDQHISTISRGVGETGGYGATEPVGYDKEQQPGFVPTDFSPPSMETSEAENVYNSMELSREESGQSEDVTVVVSQPPSNK